MDRFGAADGPSHVRADERDMDGRYVRYATHTTQERYICICNLSFSNIYIKYNPSEEETGRRSHSVNRNGVRTSRSWQGTNKK